MLEITVPAGEMWNEERQEFAYTNETVLKLEHSLISISKWEAKWRKAFLTDREKTDVEMMDYIHCMTINSNVDPMVYLNLSSENIRQIQEYINAPMTATYISKPPTQEGARGKGDTMTSELIYYYMATFQIPVQFEKWHINRLLVLIDVFCAKNQDPKKKRPIKQIMQDYSAINASRKKKLGTKG